MASGMRSPNTQDGHFIGRWIERLLGGRCARRRCSFKSDGEEGDTECHGLYGVPNFPDDPLEEFVDDITPDDSVSNLSHREQYVDTTAALELERRVHAFEASRTALRGSALSVKTFGSDDVTPADSISNVQGPADCASSECAQETEADTTLSRCPAAPMRSLPAGARTVARSPVAVVRRLRFSPSLASGSQSGKSGKQCSSGSNSGNDVQSGLVEAAVAELSGDNVKEHESAESSLSSSLEAARLGKDPGNTVPFEPNSFGHPSTAAPEDELSVVASASALSSDASSMASGASSRP
eukprot:TRINITY_DN65348_c0_g1_i1.p1 TRINITY_DN65348_c0_g1~~TRINITY_DN65348_c0_g1_i1.p1  ORF type:complete len:296 (+),score=49.33 TRINITY_DN65348_c0_g1_i1:96-983(+)